MFNFKEKLNSFLDDLEEDETKKSEEEKKQEQATAQKSRQEELAKYLESLKQNKEAEEVSANVTLSNNPISSLEAPRMEFEELDEPNINVKIESSSPIEVSSNFVSTEACVLTDDIQIKGDIITSDPLQVNGIVQGDIKSTNQVVANGTINGNIEATSASINSSTIIGNIKVEENAVITGDSTVKGDIFCDSIAVDGTINGSIYARGKVKINPNAEIYGNVSASRIAMEEGAIVQGNIRIGTPGQIE